MKILPVGTELFRAEDKINPLAPEFPVKFLHALYLKCE